MWVEGPLVFEDTENAVEQFAHDRHDDGFAGFSVLAEPVCEADHDRVMAHGHHCREVEQGPQAAGSDFADAAARADRGAALPAPGRQARVGGQIAGLLVAEGHIAQLGDQLQGGGLPDPRDADQQLQPLPQNRVAVDDPRQFGDDLLLLLLQSLKVPLDALAHTGGPGVLEPVFLGGHHAREALLAPGQLLEFSFLLAGRPPGLGFERLGEVRQDAGVDRIALRAAQLGLGKGFRAPGVDHRNALQIAVQIDGQLQMMDSGGLQSGVNLGRIGVSLQPAAQLGKASLVVRKAALRVAGAEFQSGLEGLLGHVNSEKSRLGSVEFHFRIGLGVKNLAWRGSASLSLSTQSLVGLRCGSVFSEP